MSTPVFPDIAELLILNTIATELLDGALIRLFQNDYEPGSSTVLADLTVATFTGYAEVDSTTWGGAFQNADGDAQVIPPVIATFTATGSTIGNTVYGFYVVDAAGTALLWAERFDAPVGFNSNGDTYSFVPRLSFPPGLGAAYLQP